MRSEPAVARDNGLATAQLNGYRPRIESENSADAWISINLSELDGRFPAPSSEPEWV